MFETDNNNFSFDYNKPIIYTVLYAKWLGTWQFDIINQMITLSVITISGPTVLLWIKIIKILFCILSNPVSIYRYTQFENPGGGPIRF